MFVQAANTEEGLQVICWSTCYRYKERGRFASMKRGVWRNGKRSSNVKYAEALGKRCPRELSKGVYTDLTSRYTEGQRGRVSNIIEEFSVNNEEETRDRINSTVSYLLDFDSLGVFLCLGPIQWERDDNENLSFATGPNVYHLRGSLINSTTMAEAVEGIRRKQAGEIVEEGTPQRKKPSKHDLSKVWVSRQDSLNSGNCQPGTDRFIALITRKFKHFRITKIRADVLLKIANNSDTRRVINYAIKQQK